MNQNPADFSAFFLSDTARVEINLPNGEPMFYPQGSDNRVAVLIHGPATEIYTKARAEFEREATRRAMQAAGMKDKKFVENKHAEADFISAITAKVENFPYGDGTPAAIYRTPQLRYITDQVNSCAGDMANFFGGGKPS